MKPKNLILLTLIVLIWGSAFPLVKIALSEVPPVTLGFLRFLIATPILVLYAYFKDRKSFKAMLSKNLVSLILMGLTGVAGYQVFQNIGVEYTSATSSSIIISSNPIILAILSIPLLKEKVDAVRALGIAVGFSGVITIILAESQGLQAASSNLIGDILSLGGGLSWAIYSVIGRRLKTLNNPTGLTAASMIFGTFFLLPPIYALENTHLPATILVWLAVVALSLGASCLAYALWNQVLSEEEASKVGVSLFLVPVVTTVLSVIILSEPFTLSILAGMSLVLLGVFIAERNSVKR